MKDLSVVIETYIDKDGQNKAKHMKIGALGVSPTGKEYILLDTTVNLSGVLFKQNLMAHAENKPPNKNVMVNVFDNTQQSNNHQTNNNQSQQGYAQQNNNNQAQNQQVNQQTTTQAQDVSNFDAISDDIPFNSYQRELLA